MTCFGSLNLSYCYTRLYLHARYGWLCYFLSELWWNPPYLHVFCPVSSNGDWKICKQHWMIAFSIRVRGLISYPQTAAWANLQVMIEDALSAHLAAAHRRPSRHRRPWVQPRMGVQAGGHWTRSWAVPPELEHLTITGVVARADSGQGIKACT